MDPSEFVEQMMRFFSWARYVYWSDILCCRLNEATEKDKGKDNGVDWLWFALAAQWLASVLVLIEGWEKLHFSDATIDELLAAYPDYRDLLRRFRHGVYHFQPDIFDDRFTGFLEAGQESLIWVDALFYEFKRYLWEWPDKQPGAPRLTEKWRSQLEEAVGWLPRDTIPAWDHELRKIIHDAEGKMANAGDYSSEAAKDLQGTIGQIHDFLGKPRPRSWKLGRLTRLSQQ